MVPEPVPRVAVTGALTRAVVPEVPVPLVPRVAVAGAVTRAVVLEPVLPLVPRVAVSGSVTLAVVTEPVLLPVPRVAVTGAVTLAVVPEVPVPVVTVAITGAVTPNVVPVVLGVADETVAATGALTLTPRPSSAWATPIPSTTNPPASRAACKDRLTRVRTGCFLSFRLDGVTGEPGLRRLEVAPSRARRRGRRRRRADDRSRSAGPPTGR